MDAKPNIRIRPVDHALDASTREIVNTAANGRRGARADPAADAY
jgi:hypothetical protein